MKSSLNEFSFNIRQIHIISLKHTVKCEILLLQITVQRTEVKKTTGSWNLPQIPNSSTIFFCITKEHCLLLQDGEPSAD